MRAQNLSTWLGEGRGAAPSLALPSPKTKPGRLHKRIDTPEIINTSNPSNGPEGEWIDANGNANPYSPFNCMTDPVWFYDALSSPAFRPWRFAIPLQDGL